ncbi:TPA: type IV secretion system protein [Escherichia coli]|jgi:type IV secretion system protein VirB6|uniref:Type IV secretory pathway component n=1 Tax=Edwardsiella piscicida TaxID=1263550 RepID=A0AAU8PZ70_EDWPI|nr:MULTISPECIES: type IV secretion system protein [Gammaproteobacteria]ACY86392.1 Type IV secretory pathway component [Edwardsiella tarda EIB202]HAM8461490.1 type IV secretion system protein [Escherichia coli]AOS36966.1 type IV secretion protein [Piscirickettsia salmonis]APS68883.1 type IV secretion protein [Piscirickettsia salmonis]APS81678.1 type IV secretion protein [Piscirickettsia salmonis]
MASTNLFEAIFDKVDQALDTYITSTAGDIISFITPIFTSLLIIWIAIWGYMMMFGKASEPLQDGVFRILRIGFIITLGLTVGTYTDLVVDFLAKGPETIASVITGSPTGTSAATLDSLFSKIFEVSEAAWDKGGIMNGNFGMYLISIIVLVIGAALSLVVAFLILLSKIMTTVLLAIGPLFIIMLLFNTTQRFFESWLGMVMNFGFILILAAAIGQLMTSLADSYISSMMGADASTLANLGDAAMLCIVFALCILVVRQVPSVASALGGGVALATQGAIGSAMNAMRPSTIRRQYRGLQRDARYAGRAAASPYRGAKAGYAAYQKRFGSGNSITGM